MNHGLGKRDSQQCKDSLCRWTTRSSLALSQNKGLKELQQFESRIDRLWIAKVNQRASVWLSEWEKIWTHASVLISQRQLYISFAESSFPDRLDVQKMIDAWGVSVTLKLICFQSCYFRSCKLWQESETVLNLAQDLILRASRDARFYYFYELNSLNVYRGNYALAFDSAIEACKLAVKKYQKSWSTMDALVSAENLGLPQRQLFAELQKLQKEIPHKSSIHSVNQQAKAYQMRLWFRRGEFDRIYRDQAYVKPGQEFFYQIWVAALPFQVATKKQKKIINHLEKFIFTDSNFYLKHYRLRTLTGEVRAEDYDVVRWSEWADRLYLWCWRWLLNPSQQTYQSLIEMLSIFSFEKHLESLSVEDQFMLRNVLGWLSLFDHSSYRKIQVLRGKLCRGSVSDLVVLDFEDKVISCWEDIIFNATLENNLQSPASMEFAHTKLDSILLNELLPSYKGPVSKVMKPLREVLERQTAHRQGNFATRHGSGLSKLIIDIPLKRVEIVNSENSSGNSSGNSREIYSEALCLAFECLKRKSRLTTESFFKYCFGNSYYSEDAHLRRVLRLLSLMRKVLPDDLQVTHKAGFIGIHGAWDSVTFINEDQLYFGFLGNPLWQDFLSQPSPASSKRQNQLWFDSTKSVSWRDIALRVHKPRSTTLRLISQWVKEGILLKTGKGKMTRYTFTASSSTSYQRLFDKP